MTLSPAQQTVVDLLGKGGERPEVSPSIATELHAALVAGLGPARPALERVGGLFVGKRHLATVHGCEAHAMAERRAEFRWTTASARGVVAHKAIELMVHWQGEAEPATLVDEALGRLVDTEKSISQFVGALKQAERAELRGMAVDRVTKFAECFPPLKATWRPVTESSVRVELFDGLLTLGGKTDLTLGKPGEKVIIDLKSGGQLGPHREDLRYYALLETIRLGCPPRKVATFYLDTGRPHPEDVTEGMLWAALARTVDGVRLLAELEACEREPQVRPGPVCRWCPLADGCEPGQAHLARLDDPDADPW